VSAQCWGPYCALSEGSRYSIELGGYVHVIYPLSRAVFEDRDGRVRELTSAEADLLASQYRDVLARSCAEDWLT
jgi:hypothetical protein